MQYYFEDAYYKPGGPVLLLLGGETGAWSRIPFLTQGILHKLARATNGMAVILEHRYYGHSMPTEDLSTDNLRFLTTEQALADTAVFAQNIVFPGHENEDFTARSVPWIAYGGSYAGAFAAFLRTLYPGVFWGAISSSGVTEAIHDYWQYWETIREYGPGQCMNTTATLTHAIDTILLEKKELIPQLKTLFGVQSLSDTKDFMNMLAYSGVGGWQGRNWDPAVSSPLFDHYCVNLTKGYLHYPGSESKMPPAQFLLREVGADEMLATELVNWVGYFDAMLVKPCLTSPFRAPNTTLDTCYSTTNTTFYAQHSLRDTWRAWPYQYCTQWGYLQTGSGAPASVLPIVSRTIDIEYMSRICKYAFNITSPPDVDAINKYGGFNSSYPRLAHIAGQADPWTPATPWAPEEREWEWRRNDTSEPFLLIEGAVHHWDENGLADGVEEKRRMPEGVRRTQEAEVEFVSAWVEEARESGLFKGMLDAEDAWRGPEGNEGQKVLQQ